MNQAEKELIDEKFSNIHQIIKREFNGLNEKIDRVIEYNEYQNGRIASTIAKSDSNSKRLYLIENNPALRPIFKKPYLFMIAGFLIVLIIGGFLNLNKLNELIKLIH